MPSSGNLRWAFGSFRLDGSQHLLFRDEHLVPLAPKAAEVLLVLVQKHGQLVEKEELMKAVWPDSFVEEANLAVHISQLRKVLVDDSGSHYIETIPRRGYRFVGSVSVVDASSPEPSPAAASLLTPVSETLPAASTSPVNEAGTRKRLSRLRVGNALLLGGTAVFLAIVIFLGVKHSGQRAHASDTSAANAPSAGSLERDNIVLADIANNTGEPIFDTTLRQAMATELEQSPVLDLVPEGKLQESLRNMGKPEGTQLTPEISRELCERTSSQAVLDGWIAKLGTQYVIGVRAINCRTGDHIADLQTNAASKDQVLPAIGDITRQLRAKLGESLSMIQKFDTPIEEATTPSLEALQAYSIGRATMVQKGEDASSVPYFERAIRLDPDFAMAYAALGNADSNLGEDGLADANITRAYELREHVSQREKFYIESHYFQFVTGDLDKAQHAYELWAETYPGDVAPRTDLAVILSNLGNFQQSLENANEALRIAPDAAMNYANVANAYVSLNEPGAAIAVTEQAFRKNLDSPFLRLYLYDAAFLQNDAAAMQKQVTWSEGEPGVEGDFLDHEGQDAAYMGQLAQARMFEDRAAAAAVHAGEKETAAGYELNAALWETLYGNAPQARLRVEKALALAGDRDTKYGAAVNLALIGETQRASALADELNRRFPEDTFVQLYYLPAIRGALALKRGDSTSAIRELAVVTPHEFGVAGGLFAIYIRGLAYLQAGDGYRAAIEFQKIIDHPGVVLNSPIGPLASMQLGRAYALSNQKAMAVTTYQGFLHKWQNADPNVPVLLEARAELQKLQSPIIQ
jgi:eukaryotic-like serine/threonine-protein kinase